uniref:Uncharacterized protein n=1 Tax=Paramormyrops kingsleyae TaxID=1676925 RepID=A0A3B3R9H3_9TELE
MSKGQGQRLRLLKESDHSNALGWCVSRVRMTGASGGGEGARGSVSAYFHGRVDPIKPSVKVTYNIIFHLLLPQASSFAHTRGTESGITMSEGQKKSKYSATRRLQLKSKLLKKAATMLEAEKEEKMMERESTLKERVPPLKLAGLSVKELQELCKELHRKIDIVDEARYDIEVKVGKNDKEIENLCQKIADLKGKMKRPNLKRVKKSADDVLGALSDTKLMKADFKANLKTVKKEEEKREEVTDWRKNVEAMSGMEGRKKLFDPGQ